MSLKKTSKKKGERSIGEKTHPPHLSPWEHTRASLYEELCRGLMATEKGIPRG